VTVFVDTSALYALLDEDDANHAAAADRLRGLRSDDLITHTFVVVETLALLGRRLPWAATGRFVDVLLPLIDVQPVTAALYEAALAEYAAASSARVSFVDETSFMFMRMWGVRRAFAYDRDFAARGFELVS
jgi:predicted nucleic acid-binding protein